MYKYIIKNMQIFKTNLQQQLIRKNNLINIGCKWLNSLPKNITFNLKNNWHQFKKCTDHYYLSFYVVRSLKNIEEEWKSIEKYTILIDPLKNINQFTEGNLI